MSNKNSPTGVSKPSTRDAILDAAERVVESGGARRLTIDAVVKESGFSKGGVLYYFSSKQALVEGMIMRMIDMINGEFDHATQEAEAKGEPVLPAIVRVGMEHSRKSPRVSMAILAAVAEHPELIDPVRQAVHEVRARVLKETKDPTLVLITLLAGDGLHFSDILGLDFLTPEERAAVTERIMTMVSEAC